MLQFVEFACSEELPAGHLLARMAFDDGTIEVIDRGAEYDVIVDDELVATVPDWLSSAIAVVFVDGHGESAAADLAGVSGAGHVAVGGGAVHVEVRPLSSAPALFFVCVFLCCVII